MAWSGLGRLHRALAGLAPSRRDETALQDIALAERPPEGDPEAPSADHGPALNLLTEIEEAALSIYQRHGLPTRHGQYAMSPRGKHWKFVADALTPPERWELYLANAAKPGWRFGRLENLVPEDGSTPPDLLRAAAILKACQELRSRSINGEASSRSDDIIRAVALGADWRSLQMSLERARNGPLRLGPARRGRTAQ